MTDPSAPAPPLPPLPINSRAAWYGRDMMAHPERWVNELSGSDIEELAEISEVKDIHESHRLARHDATITADGLFVLRRG